MTYISIVIKPFDINIQTCCLLTQDLTRLHSQTTSSRWQSGHGSHWLIESPTFFSSMCSPPLSNICQFYFKHIHITSFNTIIWQFVPFIYHPLLERVLSHVQPTLLLNQCCFVSSGSTAFFKFEEHIPINILITVHYFKYFYLVSS